MVEIVSVQDVEEEAMYVEGGSAADTPAVQAEESVEEIPIVENSDLSVEETGTGSVSLPEEPPVPSEEESVPPPLLVCINELQWMGTDLSTADEWLEIAAFGSGTSRLSLAGWSVVSVQGGIEELMITFGPEQDIGAGEFRIVSNYPADASRLLHDPYHVTTSVSLPNTKLLLRLYDASGALMDEVDDGVGAPFAGANISGGIKASMERIDCLQPGTVQENWRTATAALGLDGETLVLGTPGFPNGNGEDAPDDGEEPPSSTGSTIPTEPLQKPFISELLSDPPGPDTFEWIEIGNSGTGVINLSGWSLARGTGVYHFPEGTGSLLGSGQYLQLPASMTKLTLPNAGGEVRLLFGESVMDVLTYPALPEGVSFGRLDGEEPRSFCKPTPGEYNATFAPTVVIEGALPGATVSTINLSLKALSGSIAEAQCAWDFGDGYLNDSCNPPSHAMRSIGQTVINLTLQDYCGNTVIQSLTVSVDPKSTSKTLKKEEEKKPSCTPVSFSGVTVTEFLPDPLGDETAGEWMELQNTSNEPVNFCGWSIDDEPGGSKPYRLDAHALLPGEYLLLPRKETKIALNNDRDTVRLIAPLPGGGTGVLLEIPYEKSVTGESYALREDGEWLWTPHPMPGAENQFRAADPWPGALPVIISAALPDPKGQDEGEEWVELTNVTDQYQWLLGAWRLQLHDGKEVPLHGMGFRPAATVRIPINIQGMTLRNTDGVVLLIDPADQVRSVLAWEKSKAGQMIVREISDRAPLTHAMYQGDGVLRGRLNCERPAHTWTMIDLVPLRDDPVYSLDIDERESLVRSLMENKKVELQMSADSKTMERIFLDGEDLFPLLLRLGLAHVPGRETLSTRAEYAVYEAEARREKRGIWRNAITASHIDLLKEAERVRDIVEREGVLLTVGPKPGLVEQGALIELVTNVPAVIYRESIAGEWVPFVGGAVTRDGPMRFKARFGEGETALWSEVLTQEYIVRREHYPRCISVTEVYPSPQKDEGEWVELNNHCDQDLPLAGWLIDDEEGKGSKSFTYGIGVQIAASASQILSGALLPVTLNNGGDQVVFRSPDGALAAYLSYPSIRKGWSYALSGEDYCLTQKPTPGASNECVLISTAKKAKAKSPKKAIVGLATKYVIGLQSLSAAPSPPSDLRAQLSGQMAGNGGIFLSTVPSSVPWQLLLSVILSLVAVGVWWGWRGRGLD